MSNRAIIEKVETFIQRCHDLDYTFTPESRTFGTKTPSGEHKMIADSIARAMSEYEFFKDDPDQRMTKANSCLWWINRAIAVGAVKEAEGLVSKNRALEVKVSALQETVRMLSEELEKLRDAE